MHESLIPRNSYFVSLHAAKTFRGPEYGGGWRIEKLHSWRTVAGAALVSAWSPIIWRDGKRSRHNFLYSDMCGLDFDTGMTLEQAQKNFCDMQHFIGITRSHQRLKNGLICDRFRVVLPWDRRIESLDEYEYNLSLLQEKYDCDSQATDGARIFWPCTKIISGASDGYQMDVKKVPEGYVSSSERLLDAAKTVVMYAETGALTPWSRNLLKNGAPKNSRNRSFYGVAIELAHMGHDAEKIFSIIRNSPISDGDPPVGDREIVSTIYSAMKAKDRDLKLLAQEKADVGKEKGRKSSSIPSSSGCDQPV